MPHIKNTYRYKNIVEVERVHAGRIGKGTGKVPRRKVTPEEMEKINERNAVKKLRRKIHANFDEGDLFLTLTYRREIRPSPENARKELKNFLTRLRPVYRRAGQELKYIVVTEYMNVAIHHHIILKDLPDGTGGKLISKMWINGGVDCKYLYEDGNYELLASYLIKETGKNFRKPGNPARTRYSCSRNLIEPKKESKVLLRDNWPEEPVIPKGYCLDKQSLHNGINKMGYRYQYYRMFRIIPDKRKEKSRGSKRRKDKHKSKRNERDQENGPSADRR